MCLHFHCNHTATPLSPWSSVYVVIHFVEKLPSITQMTTLLAPTTLPIWNGGVHTEQTSCQPNRVALIFTIRCFDISQLVLLAVIQSFHMMSLLFWVIKKVFFSFHTILRTPESVKYLYKWLWHCWVWTREIYLKI